MMSFTDKQRNKPTDTAENNSILAMLRCVGAKYVKYAVTKKCKNQNTMASCNWEVSKSSLTMFTNTKYDYKYTVCDVVRQKQ